MTTTRTRTTTITGQERAAEILTELIQDNAAYVSGDSRPLSDLSSIELRHDLAENGQKPVAAIVACADSRVSPDLVFSAGIGRLFVIRNAGNVVTETSVLGSLEFAINHLGVPLVIVLGHSKCGAITAAIQTAKSNSPLPPTSCTPLTNHVIELSKVVKFDVGSPEEVKDAILTNIRHGVKSLKYNPTPIADAYSQGKIDIVGALYDIHTGEVFVIDH